MTQRAQEVQIGRHSSPHDRTVHKTSDGFSDERQQTTNSDNVWGRVAWGGALRDGVARMGWGRVRMDGGAGGAALGGMARGRVARSGVARDGVARVTWRGCVGARRGWVALAR